MLPSSLKQNTHMGVSFLRNRTPPHFVATVFHLASLETHNTSATSRKQKMASSHLSISLAAAAKRGPSDLTAGRMADRSRDSLVCLWVPLGKTDVESSSFQAGFPSDVQVVSQV